MRRRLPAPGDSGLSGLVWHHWDLMESGSAQKAQAALEALNASFRVVEIDPAFTHTAAYCDHYGYPMDQSANAILVASKRPRGRNAVCVVLATTRLDVNRRVRSLLGVKKLSFASAELASELTGMETGGVTPFGLPDGLPVYVDSRVVALDEILVGGGNKSTKIFVDPEVFHRMESARIVEGLAFILPSNASGG